MRTKSAVLFETGQSLKIVELELQEPKSDEVLVKVVGAGICHSDYHYIDGHRNLVTKPMLMGHEGSGVIEKVGVNVKSVKPGDKIIFSMDSMCGYCKNCTNGRPTLCLLNLSKKNSPRFKINNEPVHQYGGVGTFSQKTIVTENSVVKISDDVPLNKACLIGCAVITGIGSVLNRAKVEKGSSVAVFGCGGVGLNVIQGAIFSSASKIIAIDNNEFKLDKAKDIGATHTINPDKEDPVKKILNITKYGVDYAFEVVGFPKILNQAFNSTCPGGTAIMVGLQPANAKITIDCNDLLLDRSLIGAFHGTSRPRVDFQWLLDLYKTDRLDLDSLISKERPLYEINEAFNDMRDGKTVRSIITF